MNNIDDICTCFSVECLVRLQNAGTLPVEHLNVTLQGTRESRGENNLSIIYFKSFDLS